MLSALIWLPILGAAIIGFLPGNIPAKITRQVSFAISFASFIWSLVIAIQFSPGNNTQQFIEFLPWIDSLGLTYSLGVDGLSLPLLVLNGLLTCIAIYSTDEKITRPRFYYSLVLLLNAGVTGAFLSQDLLLFFLFYELELVPLYFLIAIWGGARRGYAAIKFLLYTTVSGILLLAAFLSVVWLSGSSNFTYQPLRTHNLPIETQLLILGAIL
ncbi:MAG TPA: proton-conducting transporter membrane subunit, partial [Phormidium sp.]